ncbi:hypothetical protein HHL16_17435 [Pseudoflavitalea sp. G-6-1-2]|uniref:hypothetical protein n=1 Tax=Pseudoflavitalea sp. G-6-1-2 TaxID=2728841 RepID=UPI00146DBFB4|nr:hypothetical protein [Pseudoflavitalea sp. G-6-1-2]NML22670.1 hypothetical protein [Pseudoflavitalea sp. G-6-1-2]
MMQNELITKRTIEAIGEEIGYELGAQMVKDYQVANPQDSYCYVIGRNIIETILAQPGCVGIQFYNAYNEMGEKTLVYVGLDADGKTIIEYSTVTKEGQLSFEKGIVADRIERRPTSRPVPTTDGGAGVDDWNWTID